MIVLLLAVPFFGTSQPAEKACFSVPGGFYEESFYLEIFPFYPQHHIRFTTNGNRPAAQSQLYTGPLLLDESLYSTSDIYTIQVAEEDLMFYPDSVRHCIVIRAAVFDENDSCISEVATNSYFIHSLGCDTHGMPGVSICADSLDLFGYEQGILVPGIHFDPLNAEWSGNYYQTGPEWERRINIEFYEQDNSGINQQAGLRTHGGNGRRYQQKSLKCYAREEYGEKRFRHQFFETIPNDSFKHLVLKPFSSSWNNTGVNDHISNQIAAQVNVETLASRPVVLYLNGEYWGVYYIHERPDERYLEDHFGVDLENVNLMAGWYPIVDAGTSAHFDALCQWFETAHLSDPQNYDWVRRHIDMDCFIDYQILELFLENLDWPSNNTRCWQEGDGPWRWIFYDGDACVQWITFSAFDNAVYVGDDTWPSNPKATLFFRKLLENSVFRQQFNDRFHDLLNTVFCHQNTVPIFESIKQTLAPEIPLQSERFGYPDSVETWDTFMGHTRWFLMNRCEYIEPVLVEFLQYWSVGETPQAGLEVFPNPSNGPITIRCQADHPKTVSVLLVDVMGRQVFSQMLPVEARNHTVSLTPPSHLAPGLYFLKLDQQVVKIIRQ